MVRFARETIERHRIKGYIFGHAGDGNLHLVIAGNFDDLEFLRKAEEANEELVLHALSRGGTATGEHGVGLGKRRFMPREHGESLHLMRRIKQLLDPNGILNPGKIFP
jgi:D-lactate dehydrogenase (cytochrome)